jgi:hypothetical protein
MNGSTSLSGDGDKREKKLCPIHSDPEPNCYCSYKDSQQISLALHYCRGNYENCNIYQQIIRKKES